MRPGKEAILACGTNRNCAKILSVSDGEVIYDINDTHPALEERPITAVDFSPLGRVGLLATSDGSIHVKNILVDGGHNQDEDSDQSPMMTPKH